MATEGPLTAGTSANDAGVGTFAWTNVGSPGNVGLSDNLYSVATSGVAATSNYLKVTNFGAAVPSGATIDGITFEVEKVAVLNGTTVTHNRGRVVKAGAIGATDRSLTWPTTEGVQNVGGAADLWGETWSVAEANDSTTGVAISVILGTPGEVNPEAKIDRVRMSIDYTSAAGVKGTQALLGVGM